MLQKVQFIKFPFYDPRNLKFIFGNIASCTNFALWIGNDTD